MKYTGSIILSPRITEKGANQTDKGVYVFNVGTDANKIEIAQAIKELYKVTPRKITIAQVPSKRVQTRGTNRHGKTTKAKKAYVYLKKGETIEII